MRRHLPHPPCGACASFASVFLALWLLVVAGLGGPVADAGAAGAGSWNRQEQRMVVQAGLIANAPDGRFHGERPLDPAAMRHALSALAVSRGAVPVSVPAGALTVERFHALLVRQLGLADVAARFQSEARRSGLRPPRRFGDEVVARLLSLRVNHPARDDRLELFPWEPITRAEAAYTLARIGRFGGGEAAYLRELARTFVLPRYGARQRRALRIAVSKIGMPYVWGGETDERSTRYGPQAHGGYDCSGLVWRVFKLSGDPAGQRIGGRTAAQMAGEVPREARIRHERLRPADLLFFGPAGFRSRATERSITHVGIALSRGFMIHSSAQGVYVSPIDDRRLRTLSWVRRVLP